MYSIMYYVQYATCAVAEKSVWVIHVNVKLLCVLQIWS